MAIEMTERAFFNYKVIVENDFTLENKHLRLQIGGKKCEGFTYELGFDDRKDTDIIQRISTESEEEVLILMQPFTHKFCENVLIDWEEAIDTKENGFTVTNHDQENYQYKFYKDLDLKF